MNMITVAGACATDAAASCVETEKEWTAALAALGPRLRPFSDDPAGAFVLLLDGAADRAAYLAVRDNLRACLRAAQVLQRSRRRLEIEMKLAGDPAGLREGIYIERMRARALITGLIALRRAGKEWAASQVRAEREAS